MSDPIALVIGNRNYSSWSVRAWLAMKHSGLAFEEIFIPLDLPDTKAAIAKHSPSGLVPVLKVGDNIVWESMAIIETLAELAPDMKFWPEDFAARAMAKSVSAQMHAGFFRLRRDMPMDLRNNLPGQNHTEGALGDAAKITALWTACLERFGGTGAVSIRRLVSRRHDVCPGCWTTSYLRCAHKRYMRKLYGRRISPSRYGRMDGRRKGRALCHRQSINHMH